MTKITMDVTAGFSSIDFLDDGRLDLKALHPLPAARQAFPGGWSSGLELVLLYNLARVVRGPLLEIGPWIGRSTCALAMGIRDGAGPEGPAPFDVVDFGITSVAEWESSLGVKFDGYARQDQIVRSIHAAGGSMAVLIENLRVEELLPFVTSLIRGDALKVPLRPQYDLIFCDTLHDKREVGLYGPLLESKLSPGGFLICDDVLSPEYLGDALREHVQLEYMVYLQPLEKHAKMAFGRKARRVEP